MAGPPTTPANSPLVRACRGESTPFVPVWFMRQAGRYHPRHRELFEEHGVRGLTTTPELNARVTLLPVEELGVDAAVMYADILLPLEDMGIRFEYGPGDTGPILENRIESPRDVRELRELNPARGVPYILEAIREVRRDLSEDKALVGFSGGPFTLAGYVIEGRASRTYNRTKAFLYEHPAAFHELMELLTRSIIAYLRAQIEPGIDVVQLFESWMGVLRPVDYRRFVHPYTRRVFEALGPDPCPRIHFGTNTSALLGWQAKSGADVLGVDWRQPLERVGRRVGIDRAVMGNLDPAALLAGEAALLDQARSVIDQGRVFSGHVFNLGHRVPADADPDRLKRLVEFVHRYSRSESPSSR